MTCAETLQALVQLAEEFSARRAEPKHRLWADLDINGSDFIEFIETVEARFDVDLSSVCSHDGGAEAKDPTIGELAELIGNTS